MTPLVATISVFTTCALSTVTPPPCVAIAIVSPLSVWAAPYGVRLAHNIPRRTLELAFAVFLASISVRFLIDLLL